MNRIIAPAAWAKPRGYVNGMLAHGHILALASQIGWDDCNELVADEFLPQAIQALRNICTLVREAGGEPSDVVRLTWYIVDKAEYLAAASALGKMYRELFGTHYPAMTLVQVAGLVEDRARVEIEATAVLGEVD